MLNAIISETFARHNNLTSEEYVERLGGKDLTEQKMIDIAMYNIFLEITKTIFDIEQKIKMGNAILNNLVAEERSKKNGTK